MRVPSTSIDALPRAAAVAAALVVAVLIGACGPDDPIAELEERRARYSAELASFSVDQTPMQPATPPAAEPAEEGAPPAEAAEEAAEGEEAAAVEAAPVELRQDVLLDILLRFRGREPLPGVTVDVTHAGPDDAVKGLYHAYVDTSGIHRGPPAQIVHRLEDVPYEEGDGFHVEVRSPIPPGERGDYQEFAEAGEGV